MLWDWFWGILELLIAILKELAHVHNLSYVTDIDFDGILDIFKQ